MLERPINCIIIIITIIIIPDIWFILTQGMGILPAE